MAVACLCRRGEQNQGGKRNDQAYDRPPVGAAKPAADPMRASAKDGPGHKAKDAQQWHGKDQGDRDPEHRRCMFQAIGRVYLIAQQPVGDCLASQKRGQAWVDIIRPPSASAVIDLALEVVILALELIPDSLTPLVRGGRFELKHG